MPTAHFYSKAVWTEASKPLKFPALSGDLDVDVAIIGGGITGLSAAWNTLKAGKKTAVLEAWQISGGTTGSSTGNLYAPIDERLFSIKSKHDEETMRTVAASRMTAIDFIERRVKEYSIDCDFRRVHFYLFTTTGTADTVSIPQKEFEAAVSAGLTASDKIPTGFPFPAHHIADIANQAQLNPLVYTQQLAAELSKQGCLIFENTRATRVEDGDPCIAHTSHGMVRAKKIIMATHSPKGIYAVHTAMESYREYALAAKLKGEAPPYGIYWHVTGNSHHSVRPYSGPNGSYLLALGEAHKVGEKENNEENLKKLEKYLYDHFDIENIAYSWAAQNYKPADNLPYIGTSPLEKNIYIATGFAADGLVWGTLAGMIIGILIAGRDHPLAKIYSPKRFTPAASASGFVKENISVASHLLKDYLFYDSTRELKDIGVGEGKTVSVNGEKLAVYRDDQGSLHLVSSVCTHMGCIVHWNNAEKTWDCPCHGSRFDIHGEVLEGPAFKNLAKPKKDSGV